MPDLDARDELLLRVFNLQIPSSVVPGGHGFCFSDQAGYSTSQLDDGALCHDFMIEARERVFEPPQFDHLLEALLGDVVTFSGYSLGFDEGALDLTFVWRAERAMSLSYKVFVHIINSETGKLVAQYDFVPRDWTYPTTYWRPGEYVKDKIEMDLRDLAAGMYDVRVGFYDPNTGERLETATADNVVRLATITR
jgi:hypothetical protein